MSILQALEILQAVGQFDSHWCDSHGDHHVYVSDEMGASEEFEDAIEVLEAKAIDFCEDFQLEFQFSDGWLIIGFEGYEE